MTSAVALRRQGLRPLRAEDMLHGSHARPWQTSSGTAPAPSRASILTVDLVGLLCLLAVLFLAIGVGAELWALSPSISSGWRVTLRGGGAVAILLGAGLGVAAWSFWQVFRDFTF